MPARAFRDKMLFGEIINRFCKNSSFKIVPMYCTRVFATIGKFIRLTDIYCIY